MCCSCEQAANSDDSNESSNSVTVPDTPPSLRKRLLAKSQQGNDSETVTETPFTSALQRKLFGN